MPVEHQVRRVSPGLTLHELIVTSDAAGAASKTFGVEACRLKSVSIVSDTATPTNAWDFTLTDADGVDVMGGAGANVVSANAARIQPKVDATPVLHEAGVLIAGQLTFAASAMGAAKVARVTLYTEPVGFDPNGYGACQ